MPIPGLSASWLPSSPGLWPRRPLELETNEQLPGPERCISFLIHHALWELPRAGQAGQCLPGYTAGREGRETLRPTYPHSFTQAPEVKNYRPMQKHKFESPGLILSKWVHYLQEIKMPKGMEKLLSYPPESSLPAVSPTAKPRWESGTEKEKTWGSWDGEKTLPPRSPENSCSNPELLKTVTADSQPTPQKGLADGQVKRKNRSPRPQQARYLLGMSLPHL